MEVGQRLLVLKKGDHDGRGEVISFIKEVRALRKLLTHGPSKEIEKPKKAP